MASDATPQPGLHVRDDEATCLAALKGPQGRCPFLHGTVRCDPYPGYVQGRHPSICPHGCAPAPPGVLDAETPTQRLTREALEYVDLFYHEMKLPEAARAAREAEVRDSIARTGTYVQTFAELEHGARVSWRNAAKCINRQAHMELCVLDCRECTTNQQMFDAIVHHLKLASAGEAIVACMSVFAARVPDGVSPISKTPTVSSGPRIWNGQLVRFAGHALPGGRVLGDPAEVGFTTMLRERFGWRPSQLSRFNVLPLVLQCDPEKPPELFELPDEARPRHSNSLDHRIALSG